MPSIPVLQSGYKEVYVRRAIALLARKREVYHNNRFRLTGAGLVPIPVSYTHLTLPTTPYV